MLHRCQPMNLTIATMNTENIYSALNLTAPLRGNFWNESFDLRSKMQSKNQNVPPLKVFILNHSHNDPGWLMTFQQYFDKLTKKILDLLVEKLIEKKDMKFVWSEISFLDLWWKQASDEQKNTFKKLVHDRRIEIMTGGWVMTDEATSHFHAMLDQLIEGHQWIKSNLNISPIAGWSIDPFGQGSTIPHFLALSNFKGTIIQRIHYSWKQYLAWHQYGDFNWKTLWENQQSSEYTMLTHNMPFDIYSTKHSCGPRPNECLKFSFRHVPGSWIESYADAITDSNVEKYADILTQQYQDTASLFPHNVALVLIGGDFEYSNAIEFSQQYDNYQKLITYVNSNPERYNNATLHFGTPSEYFNEILLRTNVDFPSLVGDFFPYADIFSSGFVGYWTGYFTTRPFHKLMSRYLEHHLRNVEILHTISFNKDINRNAKDSRKMEKNYELIVKVKK